MNEQETELTGSDAPLFTYRPHETWMEDDTYLEVPYPTSRGGDTVQVALQHSYLGTAVGISGWDGQSTSLPLDALPGVIAALQHLQQKAGV